MLRVPPSAFLALTKNLVDGVDRRLMLYIYIVLGDVIIYIYIVLGDVVGDVVGDAVGDY